MISLATTDSLGGSTDVLYPLLRLSRHQGPRWWRHAPGERMNIVFAEAAGSLAIGSVGMRRHVPDGGHRQAVDLTNLTHGEQPSVMPVAGLHRLPVNPARGVRVALHLVVLLEGLGTYCATLVQ